MNSYSKNHDDRKLIAAIGGVIVVGAVAIALIATMDEPARDGRESRAAKVAEPIVRADEPFALPALSVSEPSTEAPVELASLEAVPVEAEAVPDVDEEPVFAPQPGENLVAEGLSAFRAREFERAALYFAAQADARDDDAWARYMRGLCLWKSGLVDEAADAMRVSLEVDPDSVKGWVNLCRIENDRGELDSAADAARRALEIDPENAEAMFVLGRTLYNQSRTAEAEDQLRASLERDPENAYALNLLGLIRIEREAADEAVPVLEQAAQLEPGVGFIQNNLGMALELVGRRDDAARAYAAAVTAEPGHAKASANLARLGAPEAETDDEPAAPATPTADVAQAETQDSGAEQESDSE